ncbi:hypothetical protein [Thermogemmatispora tikiterensis]|uniref:Uncharacterized protein n=1 Tax=Thermogemmatispora tikiterensis TaxID=1825093 RepID=A0A328VIA6_9CHLR|nr:hypothetical protein [Thermogemmatispora tikiterensis]RAQ95832.1 hypothetical protein A4R35_09815 [Thermogemmatispora tikiterensis]
MSTRSSPSNWPTANLRQTGWQEVPGAAGRLGWVAGRGEKSWKPIEIAWVLLEWRCREARDLGSGWLLLDKQVCTFL